MTLLRKTGFNNVLILWPGSATDALHLTIVKRGHKPAKRAEKNLQKTASILEWLYAMMVLGVLCA